MAKRQSGKDYRGGKLMLELEPRVLLSADQPAAAFAQDLIDDSLAPQESVLVVGRENNDHRNAAAATEELRELVIVDAATPNAQQLLTDLLSQLDDGRVFEIAVLDPDRDGIDQVSALLADRSDLGALHIISHGRDGSIFLGNDEIDQEELFTRAAAVHGWADAFAADGDILVYGCDLAGGPEGRAFVDTLARLTGTDVAASDDRTGHAALGADWDLEYTTGSIDADIVAGAGTQSSWSATLAGQPPVNAVPGSQLIGENQPLTFSFGNGNQISVSDADAGTSDLEVTLSVGDGTLTLLQTTGLAFSVGDGMADALMTFTGSQTNINLALDGLVYTPTPAWSGTETLTITTRDQASAPDVSPTTRYTFDVDGTDSIGGNDANLNNGAAIVADDERGNVLETDGNNDNAAIPVVVTNGLSEFGFSFWVRTTESGSSGNYWHNPTLFGTQTNGVGTDDLGIVTSNGFIGFWTGLSGSDESYISGTTQINDDQWHMVTLSNDGANASLYIDGALEATLTTGNGLVNQEFLVGALRRSSGDFYHHSGRFDDIYIFDRALSSQEITDLYAHTDIDTVTVTVDPAPVVANQIFSIDENAANLTTVGTAVATDNGTVDDYAITAGNTGGAFAINATTGEITVANSAILDFETTPQFNLTVEVTDNFGLTDTATMTIDLNDVNDAPIITSNGSGTTAAINAAENQLAVTTVTWTDADVPVDAISYALSGDDSARFNIDAFGVLTFVAAPDFETPTDFDANGIYEVTVTVDDNAGGTDTQAISVTVTDQNDAPVITSNGGGATAAINAAENQTAVTTVTWTDADVPVDAISYALSGDDAARFNINAFGVLTFVAAPDFETPTDFDANGIYEVTVTVDDNAGGTNTQAISVTVTNSNDAPVATADAYSTDQDTPLTTVTGTNDLLLNDIDPDGNALTVDPAPVAGPANGSVVLNADGTFTYSPNSGYFGSDSFVYRISDGNGGFSQATVSITIGLLNTNPVATDDTYQLDEDGAISVAAASGLLNNDSDPDGDALTVNTTPVVGPINGLLVLGADGSFTYSPDPNFHGSDGFTYEVSDGNGANAQASVTIDVVSVNDAPVAVMDNLSATEGLPTAFTTSGLIANDTDVEGDTLSIVGVSNPSFGTLIDAGNGNYLYTPAPDFEGVDSFSYTIADTSGATSTVTVFVDVASLYIIPIDNDPTDTGAPPDDPNPETIDEGEEEVETTAASDPDAPATAAATVFENIPPVTSSRVVSPGLLSWLIATTDTDSGDAARGQTPSKFLYDNMLKGIEIQGFGLKNANFSHEVLWQALDTMKRDMSRFGGDENQGSAAAVTKIAAGSSIALSVGFVSWVLRGGALASTLLTTMPMWRGFDPLPLLAARRRKTDDAKTADPETDTPSIWYETPSDQKSFSTTKAERLFSDSQTDVHGSSGGDDAS